MQRGFIGIIALLISVLIISLLAWHSAGTLLVGQKPPANTDGATEVAPTVEQGHGAVDAANRAVTQFEMQYQQETKLP